MKVSDILDIVQEDMKVRIDFGDGVEASAADLLAVLNDEALGEDVDYIDYECDMLTIHMMYMNYKRGGDKNA